MPKGTLLDVVIEREALKMLALLAPPDEPEPPGHRQGKPHRGPEARKRRALRAAYRDAKATAEPGTFPSFKAWARQFGTRGA